MFDHDDRVAEERDPPHLRSGRAEPSTATAVQGASSGSAEASDAGRYGGRTPASPAARKRAENLGIELASIAGSGPKGRITLDDVNSVAEGAARAEAARVGSAAEPAAGREVLPAAEGAGEVTSTEIPYAGMRRSIGERMAASWTAAPMVTHHVRADVHELKQLLDRVNEGRPHRRKISITAAVVMAAAKALRVVPQLNSTLVEDRIRIWNEVNVGVAVAVVEGLIVPVVGRADTKRLDDISQEVARLARRARQNKLTPDEVTGGTFTVSSVAGYGSVDWFTPIINQPEAAILGVGRVAENVVAVGGAPEVRSTMGLSLTFDHRIADGAPAAEWLKVLLDALEKPLEMLV